MRIAMILEISATVVFIAEYSVLLFSPTMIHSFPSFYFSNDDFSGNMFSNAFCSCSLALSKSIFWLLSLMHTALHFFFCIHFVNRIFWLSTLKYLQYFSIFVGTKLPVSFCHSRKIYWFTSSRLRNLCWQVSSNSSGSFSHTVS